MREGRLPIASVSCSAECGVCSLPGRVRGLSQHPSSRTRQWHRRHIGPRGPQPGWAYATPWAPSKQHPGAEGSSGPVPSTTPPPEAIWGRARNTWPTSRGQVDLAGDRLSTVMTIEITMAQAAGTRAQDPHCRDGSTLPWGQRCRRALTPPSRVPASTAGPRGSERAAAGCSRRPGPGAPAGPRR